jgi:hypothetical protein
MFSSYSPDSRTRRTAQITVRPLPPSADLGPRRRIPHADRPSAKSLRATEMWRRHTPERRLFTSLRGRSPLPYRAQISPFRAALSAASTGGVVRHPSRLVPVRIDCDRERSGGHWSARRGHGDPAVPVDDRRADTRDHRPKGAAACGNPVSHDYNAKPAPHPVILTLTRTATSGHQTKITKDSG